MHRNHKRVNATPAFSNCKLPTKTKSHTPQITSTTKPAVSIYCSLYRNSLGNYSYFRSEKSGIRTAPACQTNCHHENLSTPNRTPLLFHSQRRSAGALPLLCQRPFVLGNGSRPQPVLVRRQLLSYHRNAQPPPAQQR